MVQTSSNLFGIRIQPLRGTVASFQITSTVGGAGLPFAIGHAFRQGDVPAGSQLSCDIPAAQVSGKNWWPDGSLKFATIAGRTDLTAGAAKTIKVSIGASPSSAALTTADLRGTGASAAIGASSFGAVSWSGADWDAPLMNWISGPYMSSWIYRKPVGSDAHLVAWLEVRLYAGGAVEILPWIENGYLTVAGATNKSAEYAFTLGGSERFRASFDLCNHCRTVLVSGARFSHWLGADPQTTVQHDKTYLQASRLVPAYGGNVPASASVLASIAQTYVPLQQANYAAAMTQTGYAPSIGLLPEWDVLYLTSSAPAALAGVIVNAYSAGRFGMHFRDEKTNRPIKFSTYPNLVINGNGSAPVVGTGSSSTNSYTPVPQGTIPPVWDTAHQPSVGYMAYLVTGRFYFMEEVQFAATTNYLKNSDTQRKFSGGVFQTNNGANTTRGAAWTIRTLAQAACITPDNDPLRGDFVASVSANVEFYHATYIAQPNNPFGIVAPYSSYTAGQGFFSEAAWMQDFFTAATGYLIDLDVGISAVSKSRLSAFFAWKAQSIIGRLGGTSSSEYLFSDAAVYTVAVAPSDIPDFVGGTGPFYKNWGEIYAATLGKSNPGVAGPLRGAYFPDPTSYWGNLQPAIAYAVQHQVAGAQAAYARMRGAPNWSEFTNKWNESPLWSVIPH